MVQMTVWLDGPVGPMGEDHPSTPTQALSGAMTVGQSAHVTLKQTGRRGREEGGGDEGTRTPDPRDANAVLSQLSYIPNESAARSSGGEYSKGARGFPG